MRSGAGLKCVGVPTQFKAGASPHTPKRRQCRREAISTTDNTYKESNSGIGFNFGVEQRKGDFGFTPYEVDSYEN